MPLLVAAAFALQVSGTVPPRAQTPEPPSHEADRPAAPVEARGGIRVSVGVQELRHADSATGEAALEVRLPWRLPGSLAPFAGVAITTSAATFAYGGFAVDVPVGPRLRVTPSFATGIYGRGSGKDLNHPVQFRTGLEIALRLGTGARLGLEVTHLSSGGLATPNPGVESLMLVYEVPF